jgi:uncharacterized protein
MPTHPPLGELRGNALMQATTMPQWQEAKKQSGVSSTAFWDHLVSNAISLFDVQRIWLFGSRARGDFRPHSDIDLAFEFDSSREPGFSAFWALMQNEAETLLNLDLVDYHSCQESLRTSILVHGKVIYERGECSTPAGNPLGKP